MRRDAERFRTLVTVINWIASVVAVVAFVASTVASGGATLPGGIVAACAIIEGADAAVGVAVLALTVVDVAGQAGEAQLQHQQAIALLSVESAETARMVGATLATCHRLGVVVTAQVAQVLIQSKTAKLADGLSLRLGIPNRIKLAQRALELEWLADDIGAAVEDGVLVFDTRRGTP